MARSPAPVIPPSLVDPYNRLVSYGSTRINSNTITTKKKTPPTGQRPKQSIPIAQSADRDALWLQQQHAPTLTGSLAWEFRTERKKEILNGSFPSTYWAPLPIQLEQVALNIPTCTLCVACVGVAYRDPNRRASACKNSFTRASYTEPAPHTGLPSPSPGWFGDVQSTQYQDRWWASKYWNFYNMPLTAQKSASPFYLKLDTTQELYASFRGNQMWAAISVTLQYSNYGSTFGAPPVGYHVTKRFNDTLPIPPATTPWSYNFSRSQIISVNDYIGKASSHARNAQYLFLMVSAFPPSGRYFSRNDSCGCWLTATASAYHAKPFP